MKKFFSESLDSRLLKYSIASTAILSLTGIAHAQVSGVDDNINLPGNGNSYQITFNNIPKFTIKIPSFGYGGQLLLSTSKASFIHGSGNKYVKALNSNSIVSRGKQFSHNASTFNFFTFGTSNFPGKGDKYIGVKFNLTDGIHYGWIKVNVSSNAQSITIISHAYNTTAGNFITTNGVLPVELTTFTANNLGDKVELHWHTATEVNNYGFEIERSAVSDQHSAVSSSQLSNVNLQWVKIGFVKGSGNNNSPKNYSFIDDNPPSGTVEYRLKQIDNNGNFKYSQIVTVTSLPKKFELWQNYPNPFNPTTAISYQLSAFSHVTLKVYDELGRAVETLVNENKPAGKYTVEFNGDGLASGIYYYRMTAGDFTEVKKLMLLK